MVIYSSSPRCVWWSPWAAFYSIFQLSDVTKLSQCTPVYFRLHCKLQNGFVLEGATSILTHSRMRELVHCIDETFYVERRGVRVGVPCSVPHKPPNPATTNCSCYWLRRNCKHLPTYPTPSSRSCSNWTQANQLNTPRFEQFIAIRFVSQLLHNDESNWILRYTPRCNESKPGSYFQAVLPDTLSINGLRQVCCWRTWVWNNGKNSIIRDKQKSFKKVSSVHAIMSNPIS